MPFWNICLPIVEKNNSILNVCAVEGRTPALSLGKISEQNIWTTKMYLANFKQQKILYFLFQPIKIQLNAIAFFIARHQKSIMPVLLKHQNYSSF